MFEIEYSANSTSSEFIAQEQWNSLEKEFLPFLSLVK